MYTWYDSKDKEVSSSRDEGLRTKGNRRKPTALTKVKERRTLDKSQGEKDAEETPTKKGRKKKKEKKSKRLCCTNAVSFL